MMRTGRDRRDWSLLIFIMPLGILLMIIAGQFAMRFLPYWILDAGMGSNLGVDTGHAAPKPLFNIQILTPFSWQGTFLTPDPNSGFVFPPFIVIQPTIATIAPTPEPTENPAATATAIPTATPPPTALPTATNYIPPPATITKNPTGEPTSTDSPPSATPTATEPPPSETPSETPTETPTNTPTPPSPTLTPTGYPSTPPSGTPVPPGGIVIGGPDGNVSSIPAGSYTVVDLGSAPIIVVGSPDGYDLVYYESEFNAPPPGASGEVHLDFVILGISTFSDGHIYYEIFNWNNDSGNPSTDYNTNVSGVLEIDNQIILMINLYNFPGTGILIDVDGAASLPPPQAYRYLVIISPPDQGAGDDIQIDSIEIFP